MPGATITGRPDHIAPGRIVQGVVVANDAAVDSADACRFEGVDPCCEIVAGPPADRRIALADDHHVAAEQPLDNRTRGAQRGFEPVIPPGRVDRGGDRDQLCDGSGHQERARIVLEEALVASQ
jgi:hypothetical protein